MRDLRKVAASGLGAIMLATGTVTAAAHPAEHVIEEGSFSEIIDECEGLELHLEGTFRSHLLITGRGPDGLLHFQANVSSTEVITNPATGRSVTVSFRFLDQDQSVADNGDGTFTVVIKLAGRVKHFGPDGKLLFVDAGQLVNETLWADDGDFPSGGTFLGEDNVKSVGRGDTADRDFCADMHEVLG